MPAAPIPKDDVKRLASLSSYEILDSIHEKAYDDLVQLASQICDTPIAVVSLVDEKRQWFKASVGIADKETSREDSFCGHAILKNELMEIPDTRNDSRFAENKLVLGKNGFRFYAGNPLTSSDGYRLGTLCVIDRIPRKLTTSQKAFLKVLSRQVEVLLELRRKTLEIVQHEKGQKEFLDAIQQLKRPIKEIQDCSAFIVKKTSAEVKSTAEQILEHCALLSDLETKLLEKIQKLE